MLFLKFKQMTVIFSIVLPKSAPDIITKHPLYLAALEALEADKNSNHKVSCPKPKLLSAVNLFHF